MFPRLDIFLFILLAYSGCHVNGEEADAVKIKLTIGTTSACSDTVRFMRDQLVPAFNSYGEFLDIKFVPWGRTVRGEEGLTCQFGEYDCWANRMQRCALNLLNGDLKNQVEFMACEFTPPLPGFGLGSYECAIAAGLNVVDVDYCVNNPQHDDLDEEAYRASEEAMAPTGINFVPFIKFNDVTDAEASTQARQRLSSMICFLLAEDPSTGINGCEI